jgi:hypothetical protein
MYYSGLTAASSSQQLINYDYGYSLLICKFHQPLSKYLSALRPACRPDGIRKEALRKLVGEALKNEIRLLKLGYILHLKSPTALWPFDGLELFHFSRTS